MSTTRPCPSPTVGLLIVGTLAVLIAPTRPGTIAAVLADAPIRVVLPLKGDDPRTVSIPDLVARLAEATGATVARPSGEATLPVTGLAGTVGKNLLGASLGSEVRITIEADRLVVLLDPVLGRAERRLEWERRLIDLAGKAKAEARRRARYGLRARPSYRPNDPTRPTVCLVHGVNSASGGFVHMFKPLEEAGYGLVVYDYPYNRALEESGRAFAADWRAFRERAAETRPWAIVAHSMGSLVSRDYVEGPDYGGDVSTLILIAPVNQGSSLAKSQTVLQLVRGLDGGKGQQVTAGALAHLGDGLGEAATDMTPGSAYLKRLNARPRRSGVAYRILAGDSGVIPRATRKQIEDQVSAVRRQGGIFGGLARFTIGGNLTEPLDELSDGTGDGCVSVARTRLPGAPEPVVIHANHAELIRAPLLYRDPGPVACMPYLLRWLPAPAAP